MKNSTKKRLSILSCFCAAVLSVVGVSSLIRTNKTIEAAALSKDEYNIEVYEWANYFNIDNVELLGFYDENFNYLQEFTQDNITVTLENNGLNFTCVKPGGFGYGGTVDHPYYYQLSYGLFTTWGVLPDILELSDLSNYTYTFCCDYELIAPEGYGAPAPTDVELTLTILSRFTSGENLWLNFSDNESTVIPSISSDEYAENGCIYFSFFPGQRTFAEGWTYRFYNFALYRSDTAYEYTPYFYSLENLPSENPDSSSGGTVIPPADSGGSGDSSDPDDGSYDQGYQDGLNAAKYSYYYGATLSLSVLNSNGTISSTYNSVSFGYVHGGISLSPVLSYLSEKGYTADNTAGVRLTLKFADPVSGALLHVQAVGKDDAFVNIFEAELEDGSVYPARFQPFEDKLGYGLSTKSDTLLTQGFVSLRNWDIYGLNNLSDLFLLDYTNDYNNGYTNGYTDGEKQGFSNGTNSGYTSGYEKGKTAGEAIGYEKGLQKSNSFLGLMVAVVDAPVSVFTSMLNFDILGYNMKNLATGLLTVALIICLIKFFSKGSAE